MAIFGPPDFNKLIKQRDGKKLIKIFIKNDDSFLRGKAARALGQLRDPQAVEVLIDELDNHGNYAARYELPMEILLLKKRFWGSSLRFPLSWSSSPHSSLRGWSES